MFYRKVLLGTALLAIAAPLPAFATDPGMAREIKDLKISRLGDTELSCDALVREALAMRSIIHTKQNIEDDSELKTRGIGAAGAVGSLLLGTLTAGVGLAAAGLLATEAVDEEADRADSIKEIAKQRRSLMVGIYHAKGCEGNIDYVMDNAAPPRLKPAKATTAMYVSNDHGEPRTAAPAVATIAPASGKAAPSFRFNE